MRIVIRLFVAVVVMAGFVATAAPAAASDPPSSVRYAPPVDAPVSDPFRPPPTPYASGNRGLEYATAAGTEIRAAADGMVVFAGVVAGRRWVTIRHTDGIRTTYGPMLDLAVANGAAVERGQVVGTSAGPLTFTARKGDEYVDPASLFDDSPPRVRLVPEPLDRPGLRTSHTRLPGADAILSALDWERRHLEALPDAMLSMTPAPVVVRSVNALLDWREARAHCTSPLIPPQPSPGPRRVAVLVGGLGSSSVSAAIADVDTATLGYAPGEVVRFSYNGGRVPSTAPLAGDLVELAATEYGPRDTVGDVEAAGHRLAELLVEVAGHVEPGTVIDVMAHSLGGLVTRVALAELEREHPDAVARLHLVATLGTPHGGADLAALLHAAAHNPRDVVAVDAIEAVTQLPLSADDPVVRDLIPGSDLLRQLDATPLPPAVPVVSIAARGDLVVPSPRARLDGATNVVVPVAGLTAHDHLPGSAVVTRELGLALAGMGPTCESAADAAIDAVTGGLIETGEHTVAVLQGA